MSFVYRQSTGELFRNGQLVAVGYSGNGSGVNNPAMQSVRGVGPIPVGKYTILRARTSDTVGPVAMPLVPAAGNKMFGRSAFLIHGDNKARNRSASHGCIIQDRGPRELVAAAVVDGDNQLEVVA